MLDFIKRFLIACIMGVCITLLFLGSKMVQADLQQWEIKKEVRE